MPFNRELGYILNRCLDGCEISGNWLNALVVFIIYKKVIKDIKTIIDSISFADE